MLPNILAVDVNIYPNCVMDNNMGKKSAGTHKAANLRNLSFEFLVYHAHP